MPADLDAVHAGQADIEDHHVGIDLARQIECAAAVVCEMNFEGFSLEITGDHLCQRHFVVDHQCPVVRYGTCGGSAR
ncbi:Uncharacterised protein [Mycobacteroides abscessus subsp. abscessus]|nr:Uncharacterised protein [Mycobacteroides abscessus subsp. abscessus]